MNRTDAGGSVLEPKSQSGCELHPDASADEADAPLSFAY